MPWYPWSYPAEGVISENAFASPVDVPLTFVAPAKCTEHLNCLRAKSCWNWAAPTQGLFRLLSPIDIQALMPGTERRIEQISLKTVNIISGAYWWSGDVTLLLYAGGVEVWRRAQVEHTPSWVDRKIPVEGAEGLDVTTYADLDLGVFMYAKAGLTGCIDLHDKDLVISGVYYSDAAPEQGSLEVIVMDTDRYVIGGLTARVKEGSRVIDTEVTDAQGKVVFPTLNVDPVKGYSPYTVEVLSAPATMWSKGYEGTEESVRVYPGPNATSLTVSSLPKTSLPWYAWAAIGIGTVVITVGALQVFRPAGPPIYIVK